MKITLFAIAAFMGAALLLPLAPAQPAKPVSSNPAQPAKQASNSAPTPATTPAQPALKGFPFTNETLLYTANWPSGIGLGEAHLSAIRGGTGWNFELGLDAGIPGFLVKDTFRSTATTALCSQTFSKDFVHGPRKGNESVTFDPATAAATRTPANGVGASKMQIPDCARDALAFLFYARAELGQGRTPKAQEIIFGAVYNGSFEYAGAENITVSKKTSLADKIICHIKGPASDVQFDAYFDRDAARTPLAIRVPLPLGKFSLELVR